MENAMNFSVTTQILKMVMDVQINVNKKPAIPVKEAQLHPWVYVHPSTPLAASSRLMEQFNSMEKYFKESLSHIFTMT